MLHSEHRRWRCGAQYNKRRITLVCVLSIERTICNCSRNYPPIVAPSNKRASPNMALQSARQLLDELMGRSRDIDPDKKNSDVPEWCDPRVSK